MGFGHARLPCNHDCFPANYSLFLQLQNFSISNNLLVPYVCEILIIQLCMYCMKLTAVNQQAQALRSNHRLILQYNYIQLHKYVYLVCVLLKFFIIYFLCTQVAHFYNTIDQQMIPSQQSMMLDAALALEHIIKNPRAAISKAGKVRTDFINHYISLKGQPILLTLSFLCQ